jgi:hypothetical protein
MTGREAVRVVTAPRAPEHWTEALRDPTAEELAEARRRWAVRERRFPRFVRQTWEEGTVLAKATLLVEVQRERLL